MEKKYIIVKHWEIYIKLKWFLERTVGKKPILLWDILMLFRMRTREKSSCLNYCAEMILLGSSVPFPFLDINSYYLRVDSFHFRTIICSVLICLSLFSLQSVSQQMTWCPSHYNALLAWNTFRCSDLSTGTWPQEIVLLAQVSLWRSLTLECLETSTLRTTTR